MIRLDTMIAEAKASGNYALLADLVALKNELFPPQHVTLYTQGEKVNSPIMKLDVFETDEGVC